MIADEFAWTGRTGQPQLDELRRREALAAQMGHAALRGTRGWDWVGDNGAVVAGVAAGLARVGGLGGAGLCAGALWIGVEGPAKLWAAGPPVVKSGVGEDVDKETLGGHR